MKRKNLLSKFLGEAGVSLVEGIMGAGMLGAVALGFSEMAKNQARPMPWEI